VCIACLRGLAGTGEHLVGECLRVFVPIAVGGAVFMLVAWALRSPEVGDMVGVVARKIRPPRAESGQ